MTFRVAVVFDDELRPETTGVYCQRALRGLVDVEHFRPTDLSRFNGSTPQRFHAVDLFLRIDDGLDYCLLDEMRPAAWWAIDTHLDFERSLAQARQFDFVFAAQRDGAERLRNAGFHSAVWLPLACDAEIHRKHDVDKQYDVCFVGNECSGERNELLHLIQRKFRNTFVGQRYFDKMARTYSMSRIAFNRSVRNDINMRVFEAIACGSLLITNDLSDNGQAELFRSGVHLETYRDPDELIDKIKYYLEHEELRERIAAAGREEAIAKHTYRHRMEVILRRIQGSGFGVQGSESRVQGSGLLSPGAPGFRVQLSEGRAHDAAEERVQSIPGHLPQTEPARQQHTGVISTASDSSTPSTFLRDRSYFEHARPELLALIPTTARRVLDVGCAAGRLGDAIKQRQAAHVTGIELDEEAAALARSRLDRVIIGDVEELEPSFGDDLFDCVICGDILEHLKEPDRLLARLRSWLADGGRLIASIPNVRHHSVLRSLLDGNWTYEPAGLLDRDHVQFFTRREIERVLGDTGFEIQQIQYVPGAGYDDWVGQGRPGRVSIGRLHINGLEPTDAEEFFIYQFLVIASPVKA